MILAGDAPGRDGYVSELRQHIARRAGERCGRRRAMSRTSGRLPGGARYGGPSTKAEAFGRSVTESRRHGLSRSVERHRGAAETMKAVPKNTIKSSDWLVGPGIGRACLGGWPCGSPRAFGRGASRHGPAGSITRHGALYQTKPSVRPSRSVYDGLLGTGLRARFERAGPLTTSGCKSARQS